MSFSKFVVWFLMLITTFDVSQIAAAQNLRELARQHAQRNPGVPLEQPAPPGDYWPKTIEELTKEADVVLLAKLSGMRSYLSPTEDRVLTDYTIVEARVIAGRLPTLTSHTPGTVVPLILTVYGGEAIVDGVLIRGTDNDRDAISDGGQYLMFLRRSGHPDAGRYEIYYGAIFEILPETVRPLLKNAALVFKGTVNPRPQDFISQIQTSVQGR
jgi:hypothetical protein